MEDLKEIVSEFLKGDAKETELELRLGYVDGSGKFITGVPRCVFEQLEQDLKESPTLTADEKWSEIIDYHFTTPDKRNVRTRVSFQADNMTMQKTHITKEKHSHVMVKRLEDDSGERCKISLAHEVPVDSVPGTCIPNYVRVKQRKCFRDIRENRTTWSYELSRCWSASNRSAVEHMQHLSEPVYEVECELVNEERAYSDSRSIDTIVESLLTKSHILLGEDQRQKVEISCGDKPTQERRKRRRQN